MSDSVFKSINPYTEELIAEYPLMDDARLEQLVSRAEDAYLIWKNFSFQQRAAILNKTAAILRRDQELLASLITREMGKIIGEARAELEKCAVTAEYYAEHGAGFLKDEIQDVRKKNRRSL